MSDDEEEKVFYLHHWNVRKMKKSYTALHIGPPTSGKTHTICNIGYLTHDRYPVASCASGTENLQHAFGPIFGEAYTDPTFDIEHQDTVIRRQALAHRNGCPNIYSFNVNDDCGKDPRNLKATCVAEAVKNGTQWLFRAFHLGVHSPEEINKHLTGFDYIFVYPQRDVDLQKNIWKKYFATFMNFKEFQEVMKVAFGNKKGALVVSTKENSIKFEDCVFIHRGPCWKWPNSDDPDKLRAYPENFKFGCTEFIRNGDLRYDPDFCPLDDKYR